MAITVTSQHLGLDGSSEATDKLLVSGAGIKTVDALNRWQTAGGQTPTQQGVDKCGYTRPSPKPPLVSGRQAHRLLTDSQMPPTHLEPCLYCPGVNHMEVGANTSRRE